MRPVWMDVSVVVSFGDGERRDINREERASGTMRRARRGKVCVSRPEILV